MHVKPFKQPYRLSYIWRLQFFTALQVFLPVSLVLWFLLPFLLAKLSINKELAGTFSVHIVPLMIIRVLNCHNEIIINNRSDHIKYITDGINVRAI